jgi:hypothetical protein
MPPDLEKYRPYVDGFDLTEAQKVELIHTLWAIMESFVDRAFGLPSGQQECASRRLSDSNKPGNGVDCPGHELAIEFARADKDRRGR